jgi:glyceraldehyde 3-phosphate dehydrogenase
MLRVGINGFGRIGRAITRIWLEKKTFNLVAINDINPDINNIAYLLKYDSSYGRLSRAVNSHGDTLIIDDEDPIIIYCERDIHAVNWAKHKVDVVIDATGVKRNLDLMKHLAMQGIRHCVVTNCPSSEYPCKWTIVGVNEASISKNDFLISSSICDANAFAPVINHLNDRFGVDHGFITTLHPWLGYQNLLDGPALSYSDPGHIHSTYVLGRSSLNTLIPKTTSCLSASQKVLPWLEEKFMALSFRVPTMIVSTADISVKLNKTVSKDQLIELFQEIEQRQERKIMYNSFEALTAIDFIRSEYSAIVDHRWTMANNNSYCKLILWYDNEWGYSCRVVDLVSYLGSLYGI